MIDNTPKQATDKGELERQIMDPNVPKNEREWWAHDEITRLREALETCAGVADEEAGDAYRNKAAACYRGTKDEALVRATAERIARKIRYLKKMKGAVNQ